MDHANGTPLKIVLTMYCSMFSAVLLSIIFLSIVQPSSALVSIQRMSTPSMQILEKNSVSKILSRQRVIIHSCNEENASSSPDESSIETQWGVSYIGGDPCGSKYNDNPFDSKVDKPGMPDDMKARIAAMANAKLEAKKQKNIDEEESRNC